MNLHSLSPYEELKYYGFGLRAGTSNFLSNGLRLGLRKTLGKITQPINSYTRFPEYNRFERAVSDYLSNTPQDKWKILDVGSPKILGLYLGYKTPAEVTLTDIDNVNVDEYRLMWQSLERRAQGRVVFSLEDARSLRFSDRQFDVVYSMSVVEHVEGDAGDSLAVRELLRVLKPGGLFLLSVPFGSKYVEQERIGLSGAARPTQDQQPHFFQRIYDRPAFERRILAHARDLEQISFTTVWRNPTWIPRTYGVLGETVRGACGFLNPLLSAVANRSCEGVNSSFAAEYGSIYTTRDVYGDLVMTGRKQRHQLAN
jgi:SAM-dependent methyltransferase